MRWRIRSPNSWKICFLPVLPRVWKCWGLRGCIQGTLAPSPAPQALATNIFLLTLLQQDPGDTVWRPSTLSCCVSLARFLVERDSPRGAGERCAVHPGRLRPWGCFLTDSLQPAASDWETNLGTWLRCYLSAFRRSGGGSSWVALSVLVGQGGRRREKSTNSNRWFF